MSLVSAVMVGVMHVAVSAGPGAAAPVPAVEGADGGRGAVLARAGATPLLDVPAVRQSQLAWHGEGGEGGEGRRGRWYRGYYGYPVPYPYPYLYYVYPRPRPSLHFELRIPLPPPWPSRPPPEYRGTWHERY